MQRSILNKDNMSYFTIDILSLSDKILSHPKNIFIYKSFQEMDLLDFFSFFIQINILLRLTENGKIIKKMNFILIVIL